MFLTRSLYEISCCGGGDVLLSPGCSPSSRVVGLRAAQQLLWPTEAVKAVAGSQEARV